MRQCYPLPRDTGKMFWQYPGTGMSTEGIAIQPTANVSYGTMVDYVQRIGVLCPAVVCGKLETNTQTVLNNIQALKRKVWLNIKKIIIPLIFSD